MALRSTNQQGGHRNVIVVCEGNGCSFTVHEETKKPPENQCTLVFDPQAQETFGRCRVF